MALKTEQNTYNMAKRIELAFSKHSPECDAFTAVFEHGQWWVCELENGAQWSVCDATRPPGTVNGFDFERIREGKK